MNKEEYQKYLKTEHWKNLSLWRKYAVDYRCEKCGRKKELNVHHLNYDHLYSEMFSDLIVVCKSCHTNIFHAENEMQSNIAQLVADLTKVKRWESYRNK